MKSPVILTGIAFDISGDRRLFENLNLSFSNKITALVGPNGIGKTTLAKIIAGEIEPTLGTVRRHSGVTFFAQFVKRPALTAGEFLGSDFEWSQLAEKLLRDIDLSRLCEVLSGGQWMRLRLAKILNEQFLILDEPTNDLDRDGRDALLTFLREHKKGCLLISHDRECLSLCSEVLELSNQGLTKFGGGWAFYEAAKVHERQNLSDALATAKRAREEARAARVEQLDRQAKRNRAGKKLAESGSLPRILAGGLKRKAQVTTGKIDAATLEQAEKAVSAAYEAYSDLKIDPVMYADLAGAEIPNQKLVAEAIDFNVRFNGGAWLYEENLNFSWRGSIRFAIPGKNGSGKTTLLKAILGSLSPEAEIRGQLRPGHLRTLYIDQRSATLDNTKTIFDNIRDVSSVSDAEIRNGLAKFLFTKDSVFQMVSTLSGGERVRAALAKGLLSTEKPELLVLDEPTNNLDLPNIEFLEKLVVNFKGALLVVSHDKVFLENCGVTLI